MGPRQTLNSRDIELIQDDSGGIQVDGDTESFHENLDLETELNCCPKRISRLCRQCYGGGVSCLRKAAPAFTYSTPQSGSQVTLSVPSDPALKPQGVMRRPF